MSKFYLSTITLLFTLALPLHKAISMEQTDEPEKRITFMSDILKPWKEKYNWDNSKVDRITQSLKDCKEDKVNFLLEKIIPLSEGQNWRLSQTTSLLSTLGNNDKEKIVTVLPKILDYILDGAGYRPDDIDEMFDLLKDKDESTIDLTFNTMNTWEFDNDPNILHFIRQYEYTTNDRLECLRDSLAPLITQYKWDVTDTLDIIEALKHYGNINTIRICKELLNASQCLDMKSTSSVTKTIHVLGNRDDLNTITFK